jgi:hypothetical protein
VIFCRFAAGAALVAVTACHDETEEAAKADVGRVSRQVKLLRDAPNPDKAPRLSALRQTTCADPEVCVMKQLCTEAYTEQSAALDAIASVQHAASEPAELPPEAAQLLSRAEASLKHATDLTRQCADSEAALRRKYAL